MTKRQRDEKPQENRTTDIFSLRNHHNDTWKYLVRQTKGFPNVSAKVWKRLACKHLGLKSLSSKDPLY